MKITFKALGIRFNVFVKWGPGPIFPPARRPIFVPYHDTKGQRMTEAKAEPAQDMDPALMALGASLMPRPLVWALVGTSPQAAQQSAGIPAHTPIFQAAVTDGLLNAIAYEMPGGWILEVAHVQAGLVGADGFPKQGRVPHLWEIRAARARFIPDAAVMALAFMPPALPAPRPPNCAMLTQMGEVKTGPGLFRV